MNKRTKIFTILIAMTISILLTTEVALAFYKPPMQLDTTKGRSEAWLGATYSYRKLIPIAGQGGSGVDYQVKLEINSDIGVDSNGIVYLANHCNDFPNDIRFTDDDGITELYYCINPVDPGTGTVSNMIIKVTDNLDIDQNIYIYYGSSDSSASDIENTLEFGDDFIRTENLLGAYKTPAPIQLANDSILVAVRDGNDFKIRKSDDLGTSWATLATVLSTGSSSECSLTLLDDGDLIGATWHATNTELVTIKSHDNGVNWGANSPNYDDGNYITIYNAVGEMAYEPSIIELNSGDLMCSASYDPGDGELDTVVFISADGGDSWAIPVTALTGTAVYSHEDSDMVQLSIGASNKIILAAEREHTEGGYSELVGIISIDDGTTWGSNSPLYNDNIHISIKDEGANVDEEGGGFVYISDSDIRYIFTTDEDDTIGFGSYPRANIKELTSTDQGATWGNKRTIHDSTITGIGAYNATPIILANGNKYVFAGEGDLVNSFWVEDTGRDMNKWQGVMVNINNTLISGGELRLFNTRLASPDTFDDPLAIEYRAKVTGLTLYKYVGMLRPADSYQICTQLLYNGTPRWAAYNGGYEAIAIGETVTDYHIYKTEWKTVAVAEVYVDGVSDGLLNTLVPNASLSPFIQCTTAGFTHVTGFLVRKYNDPEPIVGIAGNEQDLICFVTTLNATDIFTGGVSIATLNGNITDIGGTESCNIWFEWGQNGLTNSTPIVTTALLGTYSADIDTTGLDPSLPIYYEFVGETNIFITTTRGGISSFLLGSGVSTGNRLLWLLIPLILAVIIILGTLARATMSAGIIIGFVVSGLFAYLIAQTLIRLLW